MERRRVRVGALATQNENQPRENVLLGRSVMRKDRRRILPKAANGIAHERQLVLVLTKTRRRRKDDIRMTRCFVDVDIDRDMEVEPGERTIESLAIGKRTHRV